MKKLGLLAILLVTMSTAALAAGGDASGGGNTVNSKLIEEFMIEPESLGDGYKLAQEYLRNIKEAVPFFGNSLEATSKKITWYSVPRKFGELPSSTTGIRFASDQPIYQNHSEVFVSKDDFRKLNSETQARAIMHEIVMMSTPEKNAHMVRQLMAFLIKNNFKPHEEDLVKKLEALDYGKYALKHEFSEIKAEAIHAAKEKIGETISDAIEICSKPKDFGFVFVDNYLSRAISSINDLSTYSWRTGYNVDKPNLIAIYRKEFFKSIIATSSFQKLKRTSLLLNRKSVTEAEKMKLRQEGCASLLELEDIASQNDDSLSLEAVRAPSGAMIEGKNIPTKQKEKITATDGEQIESSTAR